MGEKLESNIEKSYSISLIVFFLCAAIHEVLEIENLILKIIMVLCVGYFILIFILAGIFNWQWAYKIPATTSLGKTMNRLSSALIAVIGIMIIISLLSGN